MKKNIMRKIFAFALVFVMAIGLMSCGGGQTKGIGVITLDNTATTGVKDSSRITDEAYYSADVANKVRNNLDKNGGYKHYDNLTAAILGLDRGDIYSLVLPEPVSDYVIKTNEGKYNKVRLNKEHVVLVMAAMKENQTIIDEINSGLKSIISNHQYDKIYKKYIIYNNTEGDEKIPHFDDAKTVKVAITGDLPPFDYANESGEASGFNVAILSALGNALHINYEMVNCDAGARAMTVASGKADVVFWMSGTAKDENGNNVDFTEDVPDKMIVSDRYAIVPRTFIYKTDNDLLNKYLSEYVVK